MAHRLTGASGTERATAPDDEDDTNRPTIARRSYLGLAAAALAALVTAGRTAAAALPDGGPDTATRTILIRGGDDVSRYELTVGSGLAPDDGSDARISGNSVEGVVRDEDRRYRFDGELHDLTVDGAAEVRLDTGR